MEERLAMQYSDGSFGVFAQGHRAADGRDDCLVVDANENNPDRFTKLVKVEIRVVEVIETPKRIAQTGSAQCLACGRGEG